MDVWVGGEVNREVNRRMDGKSLQTCLKNYQHLLSLSEFSLNMMLK